MIVVLALQQDEAAHSLVARWSADGARLMTARDLSTAGWRHYVGVDGRPMAVVDGQVVADDAVRAVLTRLPCIVEEELVTIAPEDRGYVAAEMTAFLLSWLGRLTCPVLNRPTPTCLAGPYWRWERWVRAAARCGMPVQPMHRLAARGGQQGSLPAPVVPGATVTVVGERCLGAADETLKEQARRLAALAGAQLLAVHFAGPDRGARFVGADLWPDVGDDKVADALGDCLLRGTGAGR